MNFQVTLQTLGNADDKILVGTTEQLRDPDWVGDKLRAFGHTYSAAEVDQILPHLVDKAVVVEPIVHETKPVIAKVSLRRRLLGDAA